jgi:hypothetical protein
MSTKAKATTKAATTAKTATAKPTATKFSWSDLPSIRRNFDGVAKHVGSLPEGKPKQTIMNALEQLYVGVAHAFQGVVGAGPIEA